MNSFSHSPFFLNFISVAMRSFAYVALVAIIAVAAAVEADLPDANFSSDKVKVFTSNVELDKALKGKNSVVCFFNARYVLCSLFPSPMTFPHPRPIPLFLFHKSSLILIINSSSGSLFFGFSLLL